MKEYKVEQYKADMVTNAINAFNEGYKLGREYGNMIFGNKRKIKVDYVDSGDCKIEFAKLNDGMLRSYGRMMPF